MLNLFVTLLIIALVAAVLGFGGIAGAAIGLAKVIFFICACAPSGVTAIWWFSRGVPQAVMVTGGALAAQA